MKRRQHADGLLSDRVRFLFEKDEQARRVQSEAGLRAVEEPEPTVPLGLETAERRALVVTAKELYRIRRARNRYFSDEMFGEAAWDILLKLYIAAEDQALTITAAGVASGVPQTTSLRWISWLEQAGLIDRHRHQHDARVTFLQLTSLASAKMDGYLQAVLRI